MPTKPVLLTVDDDLPVLRAVERDLRSRYGSDYRVVAATSGIEALEAVRQLTLRGSTVSLMPEGLQAGISREEFTDLIEYLVTLKQPESALTSNRGMPANIPELVKPIAVRP